MISDIERDDLHREILRTQGPLTSRTGYDALGRKAYQFATHLPADKLSSLHNPHLVPSDLVGRRDNPVARRYRYDPAGELLHTWDRTRGDSHYAYDPSGRLLERQGTGLEGFESFAYDAAGNLASRNDRVSDRSRDNRLRTWQDQRFDYDAWGNLITKRIGRHTEQRFGYDAENHLVHATSYRDGNLVSEARYHYDSLGRRSAKVVEQDGATKRTDFLWQGLRLLQERSGDQQQLYLYEPDSYAPLARVDGAGGDAKFYYFHTDPIGTPLDVTDENGQMVWQASYKAWGEVETYHTQAIEQNLRFQGQYFDAETGLHYNTFRYYDPGVGRFVTQDPIGLAGGFNLYQYADNSQSWIDPAGLATYNTMPSIDGFQKHHIVPQQLADHPAFKASGMSIHSTKNIIYLPTHAENHPNRAIHRGSHPGYTAEVRNGLNEIELVGRQQGWNQTQHQSAVNDLISDNRQGLKTGEIRLNKNSVRRGAC